MTLDTLLRLAAVFGLSIRVMERINRLTDTWGTKALRIDALVTLPELAVMLGLGALAFKPDGWLASKVPFFALEIPTQLRAVGAVVLIICSLYVGSMIGDFPPPVTPALYARYCFEAAGTALAVNHAAITACAVAAALSYCLLAHYGDQIYAR